MRMTQEEHDDYLSRVSKLKSALLPPTLESIGREHGLPVPSEECEQNAVARYLDLKKLHWFHPPNGGHRGNKVAAAKLKKAGTKKGVPDIIITDAPPLYPCAPGVIIELKKIKGGTVSSDQREWLEHFEQRGWIVRVCKGALEALVFLKSLGW